MKITQILTTEEIAFIKKLCVRYNRDFILIDGVKIRVPVDEWRKALDKQVI